MRKSKEEAAQTRKRIVTAAAKEFRKNGVVATGLNDLMSAAGLTHGGFYKHFESKDQLVAEACAEAIETVTVMLGKASDEGAPVAKTYLSPFHRDHPDEGCALAAIGSELGRCDEKSRAIASNGFQKLVELLMDKSGQMPAKISKKRALVAASTMIGALTVSRILNDPNLSDEVLKEAQKSLIGN